MYVLIEIPAEPAVRLRIAQIDTVRRIKESIEKKLGIPTARQILSTDGRVMDDDDAVACPTFSLQEDSRIQLKAVKDMRLTVTSPGGTQSTAVEVNATDRVRILREKLASFLQSSCGCLFTHNREFLQDELTFRGQGVENGDTIQVVEDYFDYDKYAADVLSDDKAGSPANKETLIHGFLIFKILH